MVMLQCSEILHSWQLPPLTGFTILNIKHMTNEIWVSISEHRILQVVKETAEAGVNLEGETENLPSESEFILEHFPPPPHQTAQWEASSLLLLLFHPCSPTKDETLFPKTQKTECWQYCFKAEKSEEEILKKKTDSLLKFYVKEAKKWIFAMIYLIVQSPDMK